MGRTLLPHTLTNSLTALLSQHTTHCTYHLTHPLLHITHILNLAPSNHSHSLITPRTTPHTPHPAPLIPHPSSHTPHPAPLIPHPSSHTPHPAHRTSHAPHPARRTSHTAHRSAFTVPLTSYAGYADLNLKDRVHLLEMCWTEVIVCGLVWRSTPVTEHDILVFAPDLHFNRLVLMKTIIDSYG